MDHVQADVNGCIDWTLMSFIRGSRMYYGDTKKGGVWQGYKKLLRQIINAIRKQDVLIYAGFIVSMSHTIKPKEGYSF